jgi:hypothetical protein
MTVQVFENGVLIWYDTANKLDGVLSKVSNLAYFHPQDNAIAMVAAEAKAIRTEINNAVAAKAAAFGVRKAGV